jgi:hypothetical protein
MGPTRIWKSSLFWRQYLESSSLRCPRWKTQRCAHFREPSLPQAPNLTSFLKKNRMHSALNPGFNPTHFLHQVVPCYVYLLRRLRSTLRGSCSTVGITQLLSWSTAYPSAASATDRNDGTALLMSSFKNTQMAFCSCDKWCVAAESIIEPYLLEHHI